MLHATSNFDGVALLSESACLSRTPPLHQFSLGFTSMVVALGSAEFDIVTEFEAIGVLVHRSGEEVCGRLHLRHHVRTFGIRALWNESRLRQSGRRWVGCNVNQHVVSQLRA